MDNKYSKIALILAMTLTGGHSIAGELNALKSEIKINDYDAGLKKTEWTIGKGSYQLNEDSKLLFDVDKDYTTTPGKANTEGWDTQFGIAQNIGTYAGFDATINYLYRYDAAWNAADGSESWNSNQYIIAPYFSKAVTLAEKEFTLGIELWAQIGDKNGGSLQDKSGTEFNLYLNGDLSEHWDIELAWYNYDYYDTKQDEYDYQIGTENYLNYTLPLTEALSFSIENFVEAYYTPDSEETTAQAHIEPKLNYTYTLTDNVSFHSEVSYEVFNWEYARTKGTTSKNIRDNNEMEIVVGFTIQ